MVHGSGREERARVVGEQARKGSRASARVNALPPCDVVKYVAIYTGDWRHWRLGSERVRTTLFLPFLALSPGLPNSRPSALIMSSTNPCTGRSGLPDQKSIREIPVSAWAMQNRNCESPPCTSLYPSNLSNVLFSLFCHLFYRWYPISWKTGLSTALREPPSNNRLTRYGCMILFIIWI